MRPGDIVWKYYSCFKKEEGEAVALNCMSMGKSDMVIKVDVWVRQIKFISGLQLSAFLCKILG